MVFVWAKLTLRLLAFGVGVPFFVKALWLLTQGYFLGIGLAFLGLVAYGALFMLLARGPSFITVAGHIALAVDMIKTRQQPLKPLAHGRQRAKEALGPVGTFLQISKMINFAVFRLHMGLREEDTKLRLALNPQENGEKSEKGDNTGAAKSLRDTCRQLILKKALKYVNACCMAWVFYNKAAQTPWEGARDGVAIYARHWERVLKDGVKTAWLVMALTGAIGLFIWILAAMLLSALGVSGWWIFFALVVALVFAFAIKYAIIDSWVMLGMVLNFLDIAPRTKLKENMYSRLASMSPAFKALVHHAKAPDTTTQSPTKPLAPMKAPGRIVASGTVFCDGCGAKNPAGTRFCGKCGQQI